MAATAVHAARRTVPSVSINDARFVYRNAALTDITLTWAEARARQAHAGQAPTTDRQQEVK